MHKRYLSTTLVLFILLFAIDLGTVYAAEETVSSLAADARLEIIGPGITLTFSRGEMLEQPLEIFVCTHISSTGDVAEVEVAGFSLNDLLAKNRIDLANIASINFIASDGYVMSAPAETFANTSVYIMLSRDEKGLNYPRSCIPDQRSMYWVKNLLTIELIPNEVFDLQTASRVKRVTFFREAIKQLESDELNNRGHKVKAYPLQNYFQKFASSMPKQPVTLLALDGFEKTETTEIFLANYVTIDSAPGREKELPLYFSEDISHGMRVKQLELVIAGQDAVYFGLEISIPYLFELVGMEKADSYCFVASDGYEIEIPDVAIPYGLIYPDEKSGYLRARFDGYDFAGAPGGGKVKYLVSIEAVK